MSLVLWAKLTALLFLRRNLYKFPENVKKQAYLALVRPKLEHACCVWGPQMEKQINYTEACKDEWDASSKENVANLPQELLQSYCTISFGHYLEKRSSYHASYDKAVMSIPPYVIPLRRQTRQHHPRKFIQVGTNTNK